MNNNFINMYLSSKLIHLYTIFFQETLKNKIKIFFFQEIIRCISYSTIYCYNLQPDSSYCVLTVFTVFWQFLLCSDSSYRVRHFLLCSDSSYCVLTVLTAFWHFLLCSDSSYCVLTVLTLFCQLLLCSDRSYCTLTVLTVLWQIFSVFWHFLLCSDSSDCALTDL